jgi:hypothetical protein
MQVIVLVTLTQAKLLIRRQHLIDHDTPEAPTDVFHFPTSRISQLRRGTAHELFSSEPFSHSGKHECINFKQLSKR